MRELTVRIRFTRPSLGNVKEQGGKGRFMLPRDVGGRVTFLSTWHAANLRFAAKVLGRHQDAVGEADWDIVVDGRVRRDGFFNRFLPSRGKRERFVIHEAFMPGQIVGINCVVPATIGDDDFWELLRLAGRYKGLSPFQEKGYGLFEVESIRPRRPAVDSIDQRSPERGPEGPEEKQEGSDAANVGAP